jgi:uncharacterized membrane protein
MDWSKIATAALLVLFIVVMFPTMRRWNKEGPKAQKGDWNAALLPLVGVLLFIAFLVSVVRD